MIKGVIFDIGGVVVRWDNRTYFKYLGRLSGVKSATAGRIVEGISLKYGFESGRISPSKFESLIAERFGVGKSKVKWFKSYKKYMTVDRKVLGIARRLHGRYTTAYLSNIDGQRHAYTRKKMDTSVFDYSFASFAIGYVKPDRRIFEYAMRRMGMKPKELLFIDNMRENVTGARKAGMNAILFTGATILEKRLHKMHILGAEYK